MIKFTLVSTDKEVWVNPAHVTHVNQERGGTLVGLNSPANYVVVKESVAEVVEKLYAYPSPIAELAAALPEKPEPEQPITEPRRGRPRKTEQSP